MLRRPNADHDKPEAGCAVRGPKARDTHTSCVTSKSRRGSISDEYEIALLAADAACRCDSVHGGHDLISQPPALISFILIDSIVCLVHLEQGLAVIGCGAIEAERPDEELVRVEQP